MTTVAFATILAGCAATPTQPDPTVSAQLLLPEAAPRYELEDTQGFLMAHPVGRHALPQFPESGDVGMESVVVCTRFTVTEDGETTDLTWLDDVGDCPSRDQRAPAPFLDAVASALDSWQFFAAALCIAPDSRPGIEVCDHPEVVVEPAAIYLAYRFEFSRNGTRMSAMGDAAH